MFPFTVLPRKIWLPRKGERPVLVHPVSNFPSTILIVAGTGRLRVQQWREGGNRGDPKRRCWLEYPDVLAAYRGMRQAQASATIRRLPQLQELHATCTQSHSQLLGPEPSAPKTLAEVRSFALTFLEEIVRPQTHALREARDLVERVARLRDALGRRNPRALAAQLTKVKDRLLRERISDIIGWLGHFLHREHDLNLLLQLANGLLPVMARQLAGWTADLSDITTPAETMLTRAGEVKLLAADVAMLEPFGGWTRWARSCATDFRQLEHALVGAKRDPASAALRRLHQSLAVKQVQSAISDLLLDIKLDEIGGSLQVPAYRARLDGLQCRTGGLNDDSLRRPVIAELFTHFQAAQVTLTVDPFDGKQIKLCRGHLRDACTLL